MSTYPITTISAGDITVWPNCRTYTCTGVSVFPELINPNERKPMLEPQLCPLCNNHAVRDDDGRDVILNALADHKPGMEADDSWVKTGAIIRIRCCASCGNIWATRTAPPTEVLCTPGK